MVVFMLKHFLHGCLVQASLAEAGSTVEHTNVPAEWGIMPRAILQLQSMPGVVSTFASAIEVYGPHAYDLLGQRKPLKIGSSPLGGVHVFLKCEHIAECFGTTSHPHEA